METMPPAMIWSFGRSSALVTMMALSVESPAARMASRSTFSRGVPALTACPSLTSGVKLLPAGDGVYPDVDEQLDALGAFQPHSVEGGDDGSDLSVEGSVDRAAGGLDAAARAEDGCGERLVRELFQRENDAVHGGFDDHLFTGEPRLFRSLCPAAEEPVQKSP